MSLIKKIGKSEAIREFLIWVASLYIRLMGVTGRLRVENAHIPAAFWEQGQPFILSFWHGRMLMMIRYWRQGVPFHMLASHHRDGMMIARCAAHFGIKYISGSSSKGGAGALRALVKMLKAGDCVGITPDGPKGPRMRATNGVVTLAKLSGCPIVPATYSASPRWVMNSWDRFLVPKAFARAVLIWGEPIHVPREASEEEVEAWRLHLETVLNEMGERADRMVGEEPVRPA